MFATVIPAMATGEVCVYTAPDGFKVVSYSQAWNTQQKLKSVYDELLLNTHGEEFKLLRKINILPGADPQGSSVAGKWFGLWQIKNGVPVLEGNRYIDIYNGNKYRTINEIARTLSHEYGHHFTYYYFYKKEKKSWDYWRSSQFALARGIKNNPNVSATAQEHMWSVQEIAAEDYVQLFGSPTAKKSVQFKDISQRLEENNTSFSYSTDIYNFHPQENFNLPLASNNQQLKNYWLSASGIKDKWGRAPSKPVLKLEQVKRIEYAPTPQYTFSWSKSNDDKTSKLEYTLVYFSPSGNSYYTYPIKTTYDGETLNAKVGAASDGYSYIWEEIPDGVGYFVVYVKDGDGLVTSSNILAVDFSNKQNPDSVLIDDSSLLNGTWFTPRVKVNKSQISFDVQPINVNGRILVPLRGVFESLGAQVSWNPSFKTITAIKNNTTLTMQIGSKSAVVNGETKYLDQPPQIKNGRTLIPLRFVSEAFGASVSWNQSIMLASING